MSRASFIDTFRKFFGKKKHRQQDSNDKKNEASGDDISTNNQLNYQRKCSSHLSTIFEEKNIEELDEDDTLTSTQKSHMTIPPSPNESTGRHPSILGTIEWNPDKRLGLVVKEGPYVDWEGTQPTSEWITQWQMPSTDIQAHTAHEPDVGFLEGCSLFLYPDEVVYTSETGEYNVVMKSTGKMIKRCEIYDLCLPTQEDKLIYEVYKDLKKKGYRVRRRRRDNDPPLSPASIVTGDLDGEEDVKSPVDQIKNIVNEQPKHFFGDEDRVSQTDSGVNDDETIVMDFDGHGTSGVVKVSRFLDELHPILQFIEDNQEQAKHAIIHKDDETGDYSVKYFFMIATQM